jgi:hypothetical protein
MLGFSSSLSLSPVVMLDSDVTVSDVSKSGFDEFVLCLFLMCLFNTYVPDSIFTHLP